MVDSVEAIGILTLAVDILSTINSVGYRIESLDISYRTRFALQSPDIPVCVSTDIERNILGHIECRNRETEQFFFVRLSCRIEFIFRFKPIINAIRTYFVQSRAFATATGFVSPDGLGSAASAATSSTCVVPVLYLCSTSVIPV